MTNLIQDAKAFATEAHAGQKRKYTDEDYIVHPLRVAKILSDAEMPDEVVAAGLLHDVLEDCPPVTYDQLHGRFGQKVADLVQWVSNIALRSDGNRAVRTAINREHLRKAPPDAQTLKYADLLDNLDDIVINDQKFAKVYLAEMRALLEVMVDGDNKLYVKALESLLSRESCRILNETPFLNPPAPGFVDDATEIALAAYDDVYDAEYKLYGAIDNKAVAMRAAVEAVIALCEMDFNA